MNASKLLATAIQAEEQKRIAAESKPRPPRSEEAAREAAYAAIVDFRGLPLTVDDIADLTGMARSRARHTCDQLVEQGRVSVRVLEGNVKVWFDAAALKAAA